MTLEIFMIGTKGYRAREAAAKLRNNRNLVSEAMTGRSAIETSPM